MSFAKLAVDIKLIHQWVTDAGQIASPKLLTEVWISRKISRRLR